MGQEERGRVETRPEQGGERNQSRQAETVYGAADTAL